MPPVFPEPNDINEWMKSTLEQNLELAVSSQAGKIAMTEIKNAKAKHWPTLDLVGAHNRASAGGGEYGETDTRTSSITFQFSLPIIPITGSHTPPWSGSGGDGEGQALRRTRSA